MTNNMQSDFELVMGREESDRLYQASEILFKEKKKNKAISMFKHDNLHGLSFNTFITDADFNIVFMDEKLKQKIGIDKIDGKNLFDVFPIIKEHEIDKLYEEVFITGKTVSKVKKIVEEEKTHINYVTFNLIPLANEEGNIEHVLTTIDDLTETRKIEEEYKNFVDILETASDAVVATDMQGKIKYWNHGAEEMFAYKREEMLGKDISTIVQRQRIEEYKKILERIVDEKIIKNYLVELVAKKGNLVHVTATINLLTDKNFEVNGIAAMFTDIGELQEAKKKLQTAYNKLENVGQELLNSNIELKKAKVDLEEKNNQLKKINRSLMKKKLKNKEIKEILEINESINSHNSKW